MEIAKLLTKVSPPKDEGVATRGASTALPPAPWHMKIFAQVHELKQLDPHRHVIVPRELYYPIHSFASSSHKGGQFDRVTMS